MRFLFVVFLVIRPDTNLTANNLTLAGGLIFDDLHCERFVAIITLSLEQSTSYRIIPLQAPII